MKIILFFLLLISNISFAASGSGNISNVLNLGGVSLLDNLSINETNTPCYVTLYAGSVMGTSGHASYLQKNGTAYQVPTGSSFHIVKICMQNDTANSGFQVITSTNVIGYDVAVPASTTFMGGATAQYPLATSPTIHTWSCFDSTYVFNSATYAGIQWGAINTYSVFIIGKETTP